MKVRKAPVSFCLSDVLKEMIDRTVLLVFSLLKSQKCGDSECEYCTIMIPYKGI